jgi:P-type Ca2+ transporter type 2C
MSQKDYHNLSVNKIFKLLTTQNSGLSQKEASLRLKKFGSNKLPEEKKLSIIVLLLHQFKNPLIYILFVALAVSFFTMHLIDAGIILAVIFISGIIGFIQEYKASQALSSLKQMIRYKAKVLRNDKKVVLAQEVIVPGDIIFLFPGDKIPADARIIEAQNFEVIEAALTGESVPSDKNPDTLPPGTQLADRENMVYLGTVVARGQATAVVVATGQQTELGYIANLVKETEEVKTPLQKQLNSFGKTIGLILIGLSVLIFGLGVFTGKPIFEMFLTMIAVIVAAIPEGLLPAMTVILAIGMRRLAKHKGLIRKLIAVETLGSVTVICTDKTGTLTQGEMRVSQIITEATKLSRNGHIFLPKIGTTGNTNHAIALKIGLMCNNALIENPDDDLEKLVILGNSTERALVLAGLSIGLNKEDLVKDEPRIAEIPFDSEYKYMVTLHRSGKSKGKGNIAYIKGAPEKILELSSFVDVGGKKIKLTSSKRKEIEKQYLKLTSSGLRVLAVGYKVENKEVLTDDFNNRDNLGDFIFVGLLALKDPLRPEAKETIKLTQGAGIRTLIVTGDHKFTAMAIAQELGFKIQHDKVMEGSDLDKLTDEELEKKVKTTMIFARVEPKHKIRIITALQKNGEVVAMTGDGVNDAPALKKADIGVALGSGTDVAKEVSDLVLLDNNFKVLIEAIKRGRITFNNIRKVVLYLLTDSFSEMVIIGGSVVLGLPLPILPAQILWIKLVEDATPAMSLSFDEIDEDVMKEPPRKTTEAILNRDLKKLIFFYTIIMDLILFGLFYYFWKTSGNLDYARTITFVGLGISSLFYIYAVRGLKISIFKINPFSNKFLLISTLSGLLFLVIAVYVPFFNKILHTVQLEARDWVLLLSYGLFSIVIYEIGKKLTIAKTAR